MAQPKTRQDSLTPAPPSLHVATGRSLIPPPTQAPPGEAAAAYAQVEAELLGLPDDAVGTRHVAADVAAGKARKMADEIFDVHDTERNLGPIPSARPALRDALRFLCEAGRETRA